MAASKPSKPKPSRENIISVNKAPVNNIPIKAVGKPAIIIKTLGFFTPRSEVNEIYE